MTAAAAWMHRNLAERARRAGGRRFGGPGLAGLARTDWVVVIGEHRRRVKLVELVDGLGLELPDEARTVQLRDVIWRAGQPMLSGLLGATPFTVEVRPAAEGFVIRHQAAQSRILVLTPLSAELHDRLPVKKAADTSKLILSPMPGLIVTLEVQAGQDIKAGETVAVIEAMKMQNIIRAERDGVVKSTGPKAGDSVSADEVLVEFV